MAGAFAEFVNIVPAVTDEQIGPRSSSKVVCPTEAEDIVIAFAIGVGDYCGPHRVPRPAGAIGEFQRHAVTARVVAVRQRADQHQPIARRCESNNKIHVVRTAAPQGNNIGSRIVRQHDAVCPAAQRGDAIVAVAACIFVDVRARATFDQVMAEYACQFVITIAADDDIVAIGRRGQQKVILQLRDGEHRAIRQRDGFHTAGIGKAVHHDDAVIASGKADRNV